MKSYITPFLTLIIWFSSGLTAALSEPIILKSPHMELVVSEGAKIVSRHDNGWETKMVVEEDGQRVRVSWREEQALILFPNSSLRVKLGEGPEGPQVTAYLNAQKYQVTKSPREISWKLPGQDVFFRTRGGKISQAVGSADYLKLYRNTLGRRVTLQSSAGKTDALLNDKGELETFDGPEVMEHQYLVRGLALQKGPVTLRFPLPSGPFLNGLPADRYLTVNQEIKPLPQPEPKQAEVRAGDPLQAKPRTWSSPELNAKTGSPEKDPLNARREKIVKHPEDPLKAKTAPDSEGLFQVKDY